MLKTLALFGTIVAIFVMVWLAATDHIAPAKAQTTCSEELVHEVRLLRRAAEKIADRR